MVFRDGRLVEEGSHDKLVSLDAGYYANLVKSGEQMLLVENGLS